MKRMWSLEEIQGSGFSLSLRNDITINKAGPTFISPALENGKIYILQFNENDIISTELYIATSNAIKYLFYTNTDGGTSSVQFSNSIIQSNSSTVKIKVYELK